MVKLKGQPTENTSLYFAISERDLHSTRENDIMRAFIERNL